MAFNRYCIILLTAILLSPYTYAKIHFNYEREISHVGSKPMKKLRLQKTINSLNKFLDCSRFNSDDPKTDDLTPCIKSFLPKAISRQQIIRIKSLFQVEIFVGLIHQCTNKSELIRRRNIKAKRRDIFLCFDFGYSQNDLDSQAFAVMRKYKGQYKVELLFL